MIPKHLLESKLITDEQWEEYQRLKHNWDKLKEEIQYQLERQYDIDKFAKEQGFALYNPVRLMIEHFRNKMQELEKGDSNE